MRAFDHFQDCVFDRSGAMNCRIICPCRPVPLINDPVTAAIVPESLQLQAWQQAELDRLQACTSSSNVIVDDIDGDATRDTQVCSGTLCESWITRCCLPKPDTGHDNPHRAHTEQDSMPGFASIQFLRITTHR